MAGVSKLTVMRGQKTYTVEINQQALDQLATEYFKNVPKTIQAMSRGEQQSTRGTLTELMPILLEADTDGDGTTTLAEVKGLTEKLKKQREVLAQAALEHKLMRALDGQEDDQPYQEEIEKLNEKINKLQDLLAMDETGATNYEKISKMMGGDGESISIKDMLNTVKSLDDSHYQAALSASLNIKV